MPMILLPLEDAEPVLLDKAITFFGRHPDCDVILTNSRKVSRKHCCIAQIDDAYVIRDLGSMNGVRVNGEAVRRDSRLSVGDEIVVGDVAYRLQVATPEQVKAGSAVKARPDAGLRRVSPDMLSRDVPVALPEEGADFVVEETQRNLKPVDKKSKASKKHKKRAGSDEIIVLGDDDIIA
jgi:predicted component of type VI protein secretion system